MRHDPIKRARFYKSTIFDLVLIEHLPIFAAVNPIVLRSVCHALQEIRPVSFLTPISDLNIGGSPANHGHAGFARSNYQHQGQSAPRARSEIRWSDQG